MIKIFLAFSVMLIHWGCNDESIPPLDQSYTIKGVVIASADSTSVEGVLLGIKNPVTPDSLFFTGDSINILLPNSTIGIAYSDNAGKYRWDWFLGIRNTDLYKEIFAYKKGYKLWKYGNDKSTIIQVNEFTDELNIVLSME